MASKCMLTTFDNPYNPFDEFTSWFMFDEEKGYHSHKRLSVRLTKSLSMIFKTFIKK